MFIERAQGDVTAPRSRPTIDPLSLVHSGTALLATANGSGLRDYRKERNHRDSLMRENICFKYRKAPVFVQHTSNIL